MRWVMVLFGALALACSSADIDGEGAMIKTAPLPPTGKWGADESCGETVGGTPIYIHYALDFNGKSARFTADGYQTAQDLVVRLDPLDHAGQWEVLLERAGDFPTALKEGAVMFTLQENDASLTATPAEWTLNCSAALTFSPAP